jgi:hypothetical protein
LDLRRCNVRDLRPLSVLSNLRLQAPEDPYTA